MRNGIVTRSILALCITLLTTTALVFAERPERIKVKSGATLAYQVDAVFNGMEKGDCDQGNIGTIGKIVNLDLRDTPMKIWTNLDAAMLAFELHGFTLSDKHPSILLVMPQEYYLGPVNLSTMAKSEFKNSNGMLKKLAGVKFYRIQATGSLTPERIDLTVKLKREETKEEEKKKNKPFCEFTYRVTGTALPTVTSQK